MGLKLNLSPAMGIPLEINLFGTRAVDGAAHRGYRNVSLSLLRMHLIGKTQNQVFIV